MQVPLFGYPISHFAHFQQVKFLLLFYQYPSSISFCICNVTFPSILRKCKKFSSVLHFPLISWRLFPSIQNSSFLFPKYGRIIFQCVNILLSYLANHLFMTLWVQRLGQNINICNFGRYSKISPPWKSGLLSL